MSGLKESVLNINVEFKNSYIVLDFWAKPARIAVLEIVFPENAVTLRVLSDNIGWQGPAYSPVF